MGGKTDLDRVTAYVPPELKQELEEWAAAEERSVSWLVSKLISNALQERRKNLTQKQIAEANSSGTIRV